MASAFPASQTYASKFSAVLCPKCNLMVWFPGLYGLLVEKFPDKMTHSSGHEWPHSVWLKLGKRGDSPWLVSPSSWAQQSTICVFPPSRGYLGHNQGAITFCWLFSNSASYHRSVCSSALNPRDQTFTWVMNFGWVRGLPLVLAGLVYQCWVPVTAFSRAPGCTVSQPLYKQEVQPAWLHVTLKYTNPVL